MSIADCRIALPCLALFAFTPGIIKVSEYVYLKISILQ